MKAKSILLIAVVALLVIVPLTAVFVHLNFSFHRRSWEKSRIEAQREAAHGFFAKAAELYDFALADAGRFPITRLLHATTFAEAADTLAHLKKYDEADQYYERALSLRGDSDSQDWLTVHFACLSGLGQAQFEQGDLQKAQSTLLAALPLYRKLTSTQQRDSDDLIAGDEQTRNMICLAAIFDKQSNSFKAKIYVEQAQQLWLKFPVDLRTKKELAHLAEKYKVAPTDADASGS